MSAPDVVLDGDVDVLAELSESEPHAASIRTNDAAPATTATDEDIRGKFTLATLQPRQRAERARSPPDH
jgi:hypothetical protein